MTTVGAWLEAHPDLERRDREVLLCRAAGLTRADLIARPERALGEDTTGTLRSWVERRRRGEPVAYILGEREFWGLPFEVSPAVLVPRPETELLVEAALAVMSSGVGVEPENSRPGGRSHRGNSRPGGRSHGGDSWAGGRCHGGDSWPGGRSHRGDSLGVLELGTGSGAVAIALEREAAQRGLPVRVTATDVCAAALAVAARNARRLGADVCWLQGDWFAAVGARRYHLVVSNPPYVADDDRHLDDLGHEPRLALAAGAHGLDAVRVIVEDAIAHLTPGGTLALEHGCDQGRAVRALLDASGFDSIVTLRDLAGLERVTQGRAPDTPS